MNNETTKSRFSIGRKIASMFLSAALLATTFTGLGSALVTAGTTEVYAAGNYGLADSIEDGNILHCFDWKISDITACIPEIAEAGFTSVQTSPVQPHDATGPWYWLYQPLDFTVGNDLGSEDDLKALCAKAHEYGVKVIVDVVANHVAGNNAGEWKSYIRSDLNNSQYFHNQGAASNWNDRNEIIYKNIGMPDLNSENSHVQEVVANYIKALKADGVDGIRWDAAKHIGLPSEGCTFWSTMAGLGMYNYGEILDYPAGGESDMNYNNSLMQEYGKYIGVTDPNYSGEITGGLRDGSVTTNNGGWVNKGVSGNRVVYWPESHDTYCNNGWTNGLSEDIMDRAFAVLGAKANSQTLYLSRPFEKQHESIYYGVKGSEHFTAKQVAAVNHFHNAMVGTKEYYTTGDNCYVVCRGGGAVVVNGNKGGGSRSVTVPNGGGLVPAGTYTDEITGNTWTVTSSTMSGQIGDTGIAVFYNGGVTPSPSGSVSVSPTSGSFTDTMTVTLTASNISDATYTTSEGDSGSVGTSKSLTIGSKTAVGGSVTVTVTGTKSDGTKATATGTYTKKDPNAAVTAYFDNSSYNWSSVYAYVYTGDGASAKSMSAWPGTKMTKDSSTGYFTLDLTGYENGRIIFSDGTGSATNRYPADQEPGLSIGGTSMLFGANHSWTAYTVTPTPTPIPTPTEPTVTVDKATGTSFTGETLDIKLTLANATSGTYSVDGGPEKTFTGSATVTIGEGKIGDSTVTVVAKAIGTTTKSYTFTYEKKYTVKTTSSSAGTLSSYYATNPNGQKGGAGVTIKSASDFKESMIVAQGVANDDPRIFRGSHEAPVYDTYALYAAWDDTNLYLGWQFVNVTDVVDPAQGYPISDNGKPWNGDIPQMILFDLGQGQSADMSKGNMAGGAYVWGLKVGSTTKIDAMMCFSSKPGVGQPALFKTDSTGYFSYTEGITNFKEGGISFTYEDGFFGSHIYGVNGNGYAGYTPADLASDSSDWVDFLTKGHDKAQDTFYVMTIPFSALGITRSYLESTGIGVMHVSTFGEGGIASCPMDMTFLDNATEPYSADESTSQEKADTDCVTVALARVGAGDTPTPTPIPTPTPTPGTPLQVNFGADKSAPQLTTTALTLKGIGMGGTSPYKYAFYVDGTQVQASSATATYSWKPGTAKKHTIKCVITDSTGATATSEKTFTAEGQNTPDPDPTPTPTALTNSSKISATSITLGKSVTLTGAASGGTSPYQYAFYAKKSSATSYTTVQAYSTTKTATFTPAAATTYDIRIRVKDSDGTTKAKDFTLKVTSPATTALTNTSKLSATSVALGKSVTVTCAATGGTSPYQYAVYYKKSSSTSYTTVQAYSTTKTVTIKPAAATVYNIRVKVKDAKSTVKTADFDLTVTNAAANALANASTVSATSVALGNSITITGKATGGTTPYQYAAYYKKSSSSSYTTLKAYSTTAKMTFKPAVQTTYNLRVKVKDAKNTVKTKDFTIKVTAAALANASTVSATSVALGNSITITGKATGGKTPYQYAAYYKKSSSSSYTTLKAYSTTAKMTFKPAVQTTYNLRVKVKDNAGTVKNKDFTIKVTAAALANASTVSATSVALGSSITITGKATGGTTPYQYAAYYKKSTSSSYTTLKAYSTTAKMTFKPAVQTTYNLRVKVKDAKNTVKTKDFTIKVTAAPLANASTVSATSVTLGKSVTITGKATGGTTPYQYAAYYKKSSSTSYTTLKAYSTTAKMTFKPAVQTTYNLRVKVKDAKNTVKTKDFTIKVTAAALANASTVSATSVTLGKSVTITGKATGGTSPYKYAAYYKKSSSTSYTTIQGYSTTSKMTIKPAAATTYDIRVKVKDAKGTIATKDFKVTVK